MSVTALRNIYQLKVTLIGSKPPIWRRLLVPGNIALGEFHLTLQIAMGWTDSHLHQFIADDVYYGIQNEDFGIEMGIENEDNYKLNQLLKSEKDIIKYEYDFGDGWEHKVLLEKILPFDKDRQLPCCLTGKKACPPEDCGGVWGYRELVEAMNDPEHPEHESMLEWLGGDFDTEALDIDEINNLLFEYVG